jgi:protein-S-isoprenylcysteine O-methyltransferase Ste14
MIAWANSAVLVAATAATAVLYIKSAGPAALEQRVGPSGDAWARCARYRVASMAGMIVAMANYVVFYFYPLPVPLPEAFRWPWWVSAVIGVGIAIPSGTMLARGMKDAGEETVRPRKEQTLYGGIYEKVRHPQAWEALLWFTIAFLLHSPFLVLYSFVWLPLEYAMVMAEERDLVIRFGQEYEDYRRRTGAFLPKGR